MSILGPIKGKALKCSQLQNSTHASVKIGCALFSKTSKQSEAEVAIEISQIELLAVQNLQLKRIGDLLAELSAVEKDMLQVIKNGKSE